LSTFVRTFQKLHWTPRSLRLLAGISVCLMQKQVVPAFASNRQKEFHCHKLLPSSVWRGPTGPHHTTSFTSSHRLREVWYRNVHQQQYRIRDDPKKNALNK